MNMIRFNIQVTFNILDSPNQESIICTIDFDAKHTRLISNAFKTWCSKYET